MPVLDRFATSGYNYVAPAVDRACTAAPLLGGIKERIEPYPPVLIQKADVCIDTVYGILQVRAIALRDTVKLTGNKVIDLKAATYTAVEDRASALREVVISTGTNVQKRIGEKSLALVDALDMLIDQYLPDPGVVDKKSGPEEVQGVIPRMLHIPVKIPARMVKITIVKAQNGCEFIQVQIKWAIKLTAEQKAKLQELVESKSRGIANKISSSSLVKRAGALQQITMDRASGIVVTTSKGVHDVTSSVLGKQRADDIFVLVGKGLPFLKIATRTSASTGNLSDSSSSEAEASTSEVGKVKAEPESGSGEGGKEQPLVQLERFLQEATEPPKP